MAAPHKVDALRHAVRSAVLFACGIALLVWPGHGWEYPVDIAIGVWGVFGGWWYFDRAFDAAKTPPKVDPEGRPRRRQHAGEGVDGHTQEGQGTQGMNTEKNTPTPFISTYPPGSGDHVPDLAPEHYRGDGMEPWDVIDAFGLDFYVGNCIKYLLRAGKKGPRMEDLVKARNYINKAIQLEAE